MADDSISKLTKDALETLMADVQYRSEDAFVSVIGTTEGEFDGYPILRILPGDQSSDKSSVSQNDRTISYIFQVTLPLEPNKESEANTYDYMYDLTDLILNTLDSADLSQALSGLGMPTWILNARRGDWYPLETSTGMLLACDTNVEVRYSRDN